ncbi:MAG: AI-2E family transporter [Nostocoides sp.]
MTAQQNPTSETNGNGSLPLRHLRIEFTGRNIWRTGWVILALAALASFLLFVLHDGGGVIFTVLMSWFAAIAMEPAVRKLSTKMSRGRATVIVMGGVAIFMVLFLLAFGNLFLNQIATLIESIPNVVQGAVSWVNERFGTTYDTQDILHSIKLTPAQASKYAQGVLGGVLGIIGSVVGALFSGFTILMFTFYLSADNPRLRLWIARLLPARQQRVFVSVWELVRIKTGGYVAARVILAALNAGTSAIVFAIIGLPSWLALGVWTGLVAQFVPTIGTYISIVLPVLVGLVSDRPWTGIAALVWAIAYQQVENLFIEPRISARAVNIHPAVSFGSVLLGSSLFGIAGALLAVPVTAALISLLDVYGKRYDLVEELRDQGVAEDVRIPDAGDG